MCIIKCILESIVSHYCHQKMIAIVGGVMINAIAKITGITPAAFTFNGKCVDCPPTGVRSTTARFAY